MHNYSEDKHTQKKIYIMLQDYKCNISMIINDYPYVI